MLTRNCWTYIGHWGHTSKKGDITVIEIIIHSELPSFGDSDLIHPSFRVNASAKCCLGGSKLELVNILSPLEPFCHGNRRMLAYVPIAIVQS